LVGAADGAFDGPKVVGDLEGAYDGEPVGATVVGNLVGG
jgi:hypothetical protein